MYIERVFFTGYLQPTNSSLGGVTLHGAVRLGLALVASDVL